MVGVWEGWLEGKEKVATMGVCGWWLNFGGRETR